MARGRSSTRAEYREVGTSPFATIGRVIPAFFAETQRAQRKPAPSTSSSSAPAPAATPPRSAPVSWASRSRSSTTGQPASAAPASTWAASRPRRCSNRPTSSNASVVPPTFGISVERADASTPASSGSAATAARRAPGKGLHEPRQEERCRPTSAGRGRLEGRSRSVSRPSTSPASPAVRSSCVPGTSSWPRAHASSPCRGSCRTAQRIVTSDDVLRSSAVPASIIVVGAGAVGRRVRQLLPRPRERGHRARVPAGRSCPSRTPRSRAEMERALKRRGIRVVTSARFDAASVVGGRERCPDPGGQGRGGACRAARRAAAGGHRSRGQHGGRGSRDDSRGRGAGHRRGRWPHATGQSRTCTPSATSSADCGWPTWPRTRASRGACHRRARGRAGRLRQDAASHVRAATGRFHRPDLRTVRGGRSQDPRRASSRSRPAARPSSMATRVAS